MCRVRNRDCADQPELLWISTSTAFHSYSLRREVNADKAGVSVQPTLTWWQEHTIRIYKHVNTHIHTHTHIHRCTDEPKSNVSLGYRKENRVELFRQKQVKRAAGHTSAGMWLNVPSGLENFFLSMLLKYPSKGCMCLPLERTCMSNIFSNFNRNITPIQDSILSMH